MQKSKQRFYLLKRMIERNHFQSSDCSFFSFMAMFTTNSFIGLLLVIDSQHTEDSRYRQGKIN